MRHVIAVLLGLGLLAGCSPSDGDETTADDADVVGEIDEAPTDEPDPTVEPDDDQDASEPDSDEPDGQDEPGVDDAAEADDEPEADNDASDEPDPDADGPSGDIAVSIVDFAFEADTITAEIGDTVTWTHDGRITHNVTARDGSFASDNLSSGETFSHTFEDAGTFEYVCTLHNQMVASVEVSSSTSEVRAQLGATLGGGRPDPGQAVATTGGSFAAESRFLRLARYIAASARRSPLSRSSSGSISTAPMLGPTSTL